MLRVTAISIITVLFFLVFINIGLAGNFTNAIFNQSDNVSKYMIYADWTNNITQTDTAQTMVNTDGCCTHQTDDRTSGHLHNTGADGDSVQLTSIDSTTDIVYQFMFNVSSFGTNTHAFDGGPRDGVEKWSQFEMDYTAQNKFFHYTKDSGGTQNNWISNLTMEANKLYIIRLGYNQSQANKWVGIEIFDENGTSLEDSFENTDRRDWDQCFTAGTQLCGGLGGQHKGGTSDRDEMRMWDWSTYGWAGPELPAPAADPCDPDTSGNFEVSQDCVISANDETLELHIISGGLLTIKDAILDTTAAFMNVTGLNILLNTTGTKTALNVTI